MPEVEPVPERIPIPSPAELKEVKNPDWSAVVARIRAGDRSAETELYQVFSRGIRLSILRQLGLEELEDNVHDCFVAGIGAIRRETCGSRNG